ncbi:hypothetical protein KC318_g8075 [Hortaea werneckii]|uniref:Metallo-beta-lactamase domain-containing protein n=1 Tax=Hortaea werneckii TaxID=91943 RepID=A0A3M7A9N9_HORWE|nr:hypothetical protein KC334_g8865 [Hortaea werneckii]KAI7013099.1 hypothetical protein KC355_g5166 [Hortaea werneckii]KAI7663860.1 hypothetical protein KC318_g8075 [Hortaea werneckii]RMY24089.1 hypothetical protein D0867_01614 [Hortaea werneckii]RMY40938.1 hypothetical protein D0866_00941 [Hortaea werneckii]
MSTFDGIVKEFPDIRIDHFRSSNEQSQPPLASFLSHVHSDHLVGLESCKSPFIYCSPATRELLLRLEKYPHRMNFAKGILESRKQTYRHLKTLLKPIPLETPTKLELSPGRTIRVTLFDANHCIGAVAFLIEDDEKAVIYTGDIRSEPWLIDTWCRHPLLIPYVCSGKRKPLKRLDCIYLDTTFAQKADPYREFPSKAEGLAELLMAVSRYPKDTLFYFDSWTFGYEDVWQTLAAALNSQIHLDHYRYGLYRALFNGTEPRAAETPKLMGFLCGNHFQAGCLTNREARIHSCEKGTNCEIWNEDFVRITPIISRHRGVEMAELGAGGGQGDLDQHHELEVWDPSLVGQLIALCASKLNGQPELQASVMQMLKSIIDDRIPSISLDDSELKEESIQNKKGEEGFANLDDLPLERLVPALAKLVTKAKGQGQKRDPFVKGRSSVSSARADGLPKQITFPYSRHSSYSELCRLIEAFKPSDIHPCTVDKAKWTSAHSMNFLFGHVYGSNAPSFGHDQIMLGRMGSSIPALATTRSQPLAGEVSTDDRVAPDETNSCEKNPGEQDRSHKRRRRDDSLSSRRRKGRECSDLDDDHDAHVANEAALQNQTSPPKVSARHDHLISLVEGAEGSSADLTNQDAGVDSKLESVRDFARYDTGHPPLPLTTTARPDEGTARLVRADNDKGVADYPSDLLDEAQSKPSNARNLLLRQEAYDAAMSGDGLRWGDVSLASRSSHQVREEEL